MSVYVAFFHVHLKTNQSSEFLKQNQQVFSLILHL
jgi:hypothetical protein